jgi:hypothetical protein
MANTLKYKHHKTGLPFLQIQKDIFCISLGFGRCQLFTTIDVGGNGKSSDGGPFTRSILGKSLEANRLNIPNSKPPPKSEEPLPFLKVGDEAFPLKK